MWRIFRLGVKGFYGPSQGQIRIVSTTSLSSDIENYECEEKKIENEKIKDESDIFGNLANNANINENIFKSKSCDESNLHNIYNADNEANFGARSELLRIEKLLKEIKWKDYLDNRDRIFSKDGSSSNNKKILDKSSSITSVKEVTDSDDAKSNEVLENEKKDLETKKNQEIKLFEPNFESDENIGDEIYGKRSTPQEYGVRMLQLCKERKLLEAFEILDKEMVVQKVTPNRYCYNILISACGKAGYSYKAFKLYNQMKKRGVKVEGYVYTGLFNACANSPDLEDGLKRAIRLRVQLRENKILLNVINYTAMIKAFGRCGDIATAFEIADEMIETGHNLTTQTMNFLLQACISDKESGFRHAIMVWRKMRSLLLKPCIYSYTLLMRCVKECKAGEETLFSDLLERPKKYKEDPNWEKVQKDLRNRKSVQYLSSNEFDSWVATRKDNSHEGSEEMKNEVSVGIVGSSDVDIVMSKKWEETQLPNILSRHYVPGKVEGISSLETPSERFALLGGSQGVLHNMKQDHVKPTMATFTFMLESLPNMVEAEEALISTMASLNMKFDVIFFNMLIKRRNRLLRYDDARNVLSLMQIHRVAPDLITFCCLASICHKYSKAVSLIRDMKNAGFRPDEPFMANLVSAGLRNRDYLYTLEILKLMKKYKIAPAEPILNYLERIRKEIRKMVLEKEHQYIGQSSIPESEKVKLDEMRVYLLEYKNWLKKTGVELTEHPWAQYGFNDNFERRITKS